MWTICEVCASEIHISWKEFWEDMTLWDAWNFIELKSNRNKKIEKGTESSEPKEEKRTDVPMTLSSVRSMVRRGVSNADG